VDWGVERCGAKRERGALAGKTVKLKKKRENPSRNAKVGTLPARRRRQKKNLRSEGRTPHFT